jgi:hypothetical protein
MDTAIAGTDTTSAPAPSTTRGLRSTFRVHRISPAAWCAIGLTLLALAPVIVTVITRTGRSYLPARDIGTIDLRVRDVWSTNVPLVGPYSRYLWSHPGPLLFYFLAIPSGIFGQAAWATLVGGALLQGIAIAWLAKLAWQRGGLPLVALALAGVGLIYATTGPWIMLEPWNPHIVLPFFALFVFQSWLLATGEARFLPGATFVGSFLVQTHVGYAPLVGAAVVVVAVYVVLDLRRAVTAWAQWRRPLQIALVLALIVWLPPLLDVMLHWPGNLDAVARYFITGRNAEPAIGFTSGIKLMAAEFRWLPEWLGGSSDVNVDGGGATTSVLRLLVPAALLILALVVAVRCRATAVIRFGVLTLVLFVVGTLALGRVTGIPYPYLYYWRPVLAVMVALAVVAAVGVGLQRNHRRWVRPAGVIAAAMVVAATSGALAIDVGDHATAVSPFEPITKTIVRQLESHGIPKSGVILRLDTSSPIQLHRGIFDQLDRDGKPVRVDEDIAYEFGTQRGAAPSEVSAVWWVAEGSRALTELTAQPGSRVIAFYTPLRRRDEAEMATLQQRVYGALVATQRTDLLDQLDSPFIAFVIQDLPGVDHAAIDRLGRLNDAVVRSGGCRCGVVAFSPGEAPMTIPR